eukprot:CAMPEP_0116890300 /NCGR_PEP_ID=MMETSP0467-20121206/837_1 /TAXON_ID=283647 /ORGANISM="Mesodinium pulex, Strain SPMC105" /LENGTH=55 /DNA_ID=CAMNT_0004557919 /DNA_START=476 /DNA_END=643 /DNA_ORIENTATION=+
MNDLDNYIFRLQKLKSHKSDMLFLKDKFKAYADWTSTKTALYYSKEIFYKKFRNM